MGFINLRKLLQAENTLRLLHEWSNAMGRSIVSVSWLSVKIIPPKMNEHPMKKGPFRIVLRLPVSSCFQQLSRLVFWRVRPWFIQGSPVSRFILSAFGKSRWLAFVPRKPGKDDAYLVYIHVASKMPRVDNLVERSTSYLAPFTKNHWPSISIQLTSYPHLHRKQSGWNWGLSWASTTHTNITEFLSHKIQVWLNRNCQSLQSSYLEASWWFQPI